MSVDAILFGDHCASNISLVAGQHKNAHGVFVGASIASEVTVTATDVKTSLLRHDPLVILPFCGYHMVDYWGHWLELQEKLGDKFPKVSQVDWLCEGFDGRFMWPVYGENSQALDWIIRRVGGQVDATGDVTSRYLESEDSNLDGIDVDRVMWGALFKIDPDAWAAKMDEAEEYFKQFGDKFPAKITKQLAKSRERIAAVKV